MKVRPFLFPLFLILVCWLAACGRTTPNEATITMKEMAFRQSEITVKAGQPVILDERGYPAAARVQATLERDQIRIQGGVPVSEGAPGSLAYHRIAANMMSNDSFMIRGHFDAAGDLIPVKVVGWQGSEDDRGAGSKKANRMLGEWRKRLAAQLAEEGRPLPKVRPSAK